MVAERKSKEMFVNVLTSKLLLKYRLKKYAAKALGFSRKRNLDHKGIKETRKGLFKRNRSNIDEIQRSVRSFLQREDNSRIAPGKKDTITWIKVKRQKRFF